MAFKSNQDFIQYGTDWANLSAGFEKLPYQAKREVHYPEASDADIGHIYDMLTTIVDTLSTQHNISIDLGNDKIKLDHRKAIKAKFPKP